MKGFLALLLIFSCGFAQGNFETLDTGYPVFSEKITIGNGSDGIVLDGNGSILFEGTAKNHLSMRPWIEIGKIAAKTKSEIVQVGAVSGYKMILYAADEEIFFNEYIAGRWDGASNITCSIIGYLDNPGGETANDDFNMSLDWTTKSTASGLLSTSTKTIYMVTNIPDARKAQYSIYKVEFPIDWDYPNPDITASDFFSARLYRTPVGAGNVEIDGSFVVCMVVMTYQVDKVYKA